MVQLVPDDEQALDAADAAEAALARLNERMAVLGLAGRFRVLYVGGRREPQSASDLAALADD